MRYKKLVICLAVILMLAIICGGVFLYYKYKVKPSNITLKQDLQNISISFNGVADSDYIVCIDSDGYHKSFHTTKLRLKKKLQKLNKTYKVKIYRDTFIGKYFYSNAEIYMKKLSQEVSLSLTNLKGFSESQEKIFVASSTNPEFKIKDDSIISLKSYNDNEAVFDLKKTGETSIKIIAEETDIYEASEADINVVVYPNKLSTPSVSVNVLNHTYSEVKIQPVRYATDYMIERFDPISRKWKKLTKAIKNDKYFTRKFVNSGLNLRVIATGVLLKKTLKSSPSEEFSIKNSTELVKARGTDRHIIKKFSISDFSESFSVNTPKGTSVPQSFSADSFGRFWVGCSSRDGKKSAFKHYTKKRNRDKVVRVDRGFLNGSTYNPISKKFYSTRTHFSTKSKLLEEWSKQGKRLRKIQLPWVISGVGFDYTNNTYCLSGRSNIRILDANFKHIKNIRSLFSYKYRQDCRAGDGVCLKSSWNGGNDSWVDVYRVSDSAYLRSFAVPFGEIESACVVNKHLVLLMHTISRQKNDKILISDDIFPEI